MYEGEIAPALEVEDVSTIPCFRMVSLDELKVLDSRGFFTRAMLDRNDPFSPTRKQDKLHAFLWEYFERHTPQSPTAQDLMKKYIDGEVDDEGFISRGLQEVTGLNANEELINKISRGDATAQEMRVFFATFAPRKFNMAAQAATTTPYTNLLSLTYGGALNTYVDENSVLLELAIPKDQIIVDHTTRNTLENELFVEKIEAEWVVGRYRNDDEVIEMLKRRKDLPVQRFLKNVDFDSKLEIDRALHNSKGPLIKEFVESLEEGSN